MLEGMISQSRLKEIDLRDGAKVFYRRWEGTKHGDVIVYLHGLESHMEWFADVATLLNRSGFHIYGMDRRGSGLNKTDRGHMENYWILVDDIKEAVELARREHPGRKIYLIGLCWGGKIAAMFAAYNYGFIDGLVLVTPAIKTKVDVSLRKKLDIIYSNIFQPRKLFDIPLDDRIFTRNPKYIEFIKKDKLKLKKVTARFFFETGRMNLSFDRIAPKINTPVLALLAGEDVVVDNEQVKKWFARIGAKDKTIKVYPRSCHSLHFEEPENITTNITDWIKKRNLIEKGHVER